MANEATGVSAVADRYATAIFELAEDRKAMDAVADDLATLATLLGESADLRRIVDSPVLSRADQGRGMDAVVEKAGASPLTRNLIGLMAKNRRLFYLPEVIEAFRQKLAAQRGEVAAEVVSAKKLTAKQIEALTGVLSQAVGGTIVLDAKVDKSLLGGLVVRVGSRMIDSSLQTKLQGLKLAMKGTA